MSIRSWPHGSDAGVAENDARARVPTAMLILEVLAERVRTRGEHAFILHEGRRVSYREFDSLANRAAHVLQSFGVQRGDRVTLAVGNSVEYLVAAFGVLKAGAV